MISRHQQNTSMFKAFDDSSPIVVGTGLTLPGKTTSARTAAMLDNKTSSEILGVSKIEESFNR